MADITENLEVNVETSGFSEAIAAAEELESRLKACRDAIAQMDAAGDAAESVAAALQQSADAAEEFARAADSARDALGEIGPASAGVDAAAASMDEAAAAAGEMAAAEGRARDAAAELGASADAASAEVVAGNDAATASYAELAAAASAAGARLDAADAEIAAMGAASEAAGKGIGEVRDDSIEAGIGVEFLAKAISSFRDKSAELDAAALALDISLGSVKETASSARDALTELGLSEGEAAAGAAALAAAMTAVDAAGAGEDGGGFLSGISDAVKGAFGDFSPGGLGIPALVGGIGGLIGGLTPALVSVGAGFGSFAALALPALHEVEQGWSGVTAAQKAYELAAGVEKRDPTASNLEAQQKALASLRTTWADIPAPARQAVEAIHEFGQAWSGASRRSGIQKDALGDITEALRTARALIPSVVGLAKAAAPVISGMWAGLDQNVRSAGFAKFVHSLETDIRPAAQGFHEIAGAIGGFFSQLSEKGGKTSGQFLDSIGGMLKQITPASVSTFLDLAGAMEHFANSVSDVNRIISGTGLDHGIRDIVGAGETAWQGMVHFLTHGNRVAGHMTVGDLFSQAYHDLAGTTTLHPKVKLAPEILGDGKLHLPPELLGGGPDAKAITLHPKVKLAPEILGDGKPPKVPVDADTSKMAGQIQSAAKQVKVHGLTVSLSDAKLSGLAALDSTMAAAGKAAGKALDTAMAQAVQAGGSQVTGDARQVAAQVKAALAGLRAAGDAAGASLDAGLAAGITAGEGSVVAAATAVAQAAEQAVKAAAGIHSPSKVWQSMGDEMVTGLVGALENGKATVAEAARELAGAAGKPLQDDIKAALAYGRLVASSARSFAALPGIKVSRAGPDGGYEPESAQLETGLRHRLWSIRDFTGELGRLRGEGLSQALLRQVTSAGPGSALAREMAGASAKTIAEMNRTEREIIQASRRSGAVAAGDRYGHAGYAATASRLNVSLGDLRADITLIIDGKKVSRSVQSATLQRAHRNTSSGLQLQGRNP